MIKFVGIILLLTLTVCGFFLEETIGRYIPGYSPVIFCSGALLTLGLIVSILLRNSLIAMIAIAVSIFFPWLHTWLVACWPGMGGLLK